MPAHISLRDGDMPFWEAITRARMANEWAPNDLLHAANLARCSADIERVARQLAEEGDSVVNGKGTPVPNPLHSVLDTLTGRSMALTRVLQLHAVPKLPHSQGVRQHASKKGGALEANEAADQGDADGLLASPVH